MGAGTWTVVFVLQLAALVTAEENTVVYSCPKNWLLNEHICYWYGNATVFFPSANTTCTGMGATLRLVLSVEDSQLFRVIGSGNNYWIGLEGSGRGSWWYIENGEKKYVTYEPQQGSYRRYTCAVWNSQTAAITAVDCGNNYPFMCQRQADENCVPGWFGSNCTEECHCSGTPCDTATGECQYGCQLGWTGITCSMEKRKAEAKFYCLKIRNQNIMLFRVNQRGTRYRQVTASTTSNDNLHSCDISQFNFFDHGGMATLKVKQLANGTFLPPCGENMESADTYSWRFKFEEFPMTSSAYDIQFEMTCDFTNAETLERSVTFNTDKPSNKTTTLTESRVFVTFDLVDIVTFRPVSTVKLGQQIQLQMKLNNGDDYGITAISPYNCSVSTPDGSNTVVFMDDNGCTPADSQIRFNTSDLATWRSDRFETFTFQGHDKVNFQCDLHVCFSEKHGYCKNMCSQSKKRKARKLQRRRRNNKRDVPKFGTSITITT